MQIRALQYLKNKLVTENSMEVLLDWQSELDSIGDVLKCQRHMYMRPMENRAYDSHSSWALIWTEQKVA